MLRVAALSIVVVLVVACADEIEAPASLAEQLGDVGSPDGAAAPPDDVDESQPVDDAEPPEDEPPPDGASDDDGQADEEDEELRAVVAEADTRCSDIYTRGDELALEQQAGLWVALAEGDAAALEAYDVEAISDRAIELTEEIVVTLEQAAQEHAGLEPAAMRARQDVLPFFGELVPLMFEGREDEADALATAHWQLLTGFVAELAELGFDHCFQTELLP